MKVFFLILYIVNGSSSVSYVKIPFAYSLIPITCEEVFYDKVKFTFMLILVLMNMEITIMAMKKN